VLLFISGAEWIWIIIIVGVLLFGAKKIPELARSLGRATGEYEKARLEAEREIRGYKDGGKASREKLEEIARTLGIDPYGKDDDELKAEIERVIGSSSSSSNNNNKKE
ncbi:MAG: twin-arginine translocase TatA/TatE family subunit, partial [Candidatus Nitrosocaldus sp.]